MKRTEIDNCARFILSKFKGMRPGDILRTNSLVEGIRKQYPMQYHQAVTVLCLLYLNNLIRHNDNTFSSLTDEGYEYLQDGILPPLMMDLKSVCDLRISRDRLFYEMWEIIGAEKDDNPYYVSGATFYDTIHGAVSGLPPTYTSYIESLPMEANGQKPSRMKWCKNLFTQLSDDQIEPFLTILSSKINAGLTRPSATGDNQSLPVWGNNTDNATKETTQNIMRKPKVFISHNTKDGNYAKALVDMMVKLGMKYEDIFCSSHPGCGIIFGKGILNAIRQQYDEYELLVLFIHSPRYYESPVSLNEMGAAWVLKSNHLSFLTKDCDFEMLRGVVTSQEISFKAGQNDTYHLLHDFRKTLADLFQLANVSVAAWDMIKTDFITTVEKC